MENTPNSKKSCKIDLSPLILDLNQIFLQILLLYPGLNDQKTISRYCPFKSVDTEDLL